MIVMITFLLNACGARQPFDAEKLPLSPTLRQWQPVSSPGAVVLGLHSFGDYSAAFTQLGPLFANAGIYLESYDQAGFGERQIEGRWAGESLLVKEAARRIAYLSEVYHQPVFVMGESLGGAVAILAALEHPQNVAGIILSAPAVREGIRFRYTWNVAIAGAAALAPGYRVKVERDPQDPLLAPSQARRLAQDDKVIRQVRLDSYWGLIQLADSASDLAPTLNQNDTPVLLLYGERDTSVPEAGIVALRQHLQGQLTYHAIAQGPHLLLQGKHWQTTGNLIIDWVKQQQDTLQALQSRPASHSADTAFGPPGQLQARSD